MCYSSVFEAREDFVLPVSIPYRHRLGEARDHGKKEKQSKSLAWWVSCMSWKSMLHKMSFFCPWNSLKDRNGVKNVVTNENDVDAFWFVCLFVFLLCCQAGESRVPKSFAPLGFGSCVCVWSVFVRCWNVLLFFCLPFVNVSVY